MARTSGVGNVIKYWNKLSDWSKIFTIALVALLAVIIVNAVRGIVRVSKLRQSLSRSVDKMSTMISMRPCMMI